MSARRVEGWAEGYAPPWVIGYTLRLTNGFPQPLDAVHVRTARHMHDTGLIVVSPMAPGVTAALPVGTQEDLGFYEIGAFDVQGHMIARIPRGGGSISPAEAASSLPFRPNDHTDDWTLTPADMLDMTANYRLTILNQTPDVWEEVTVFYASAIEGTVGLASSPVDPEGRVSFNLGPAGAMDGYVFAIWVDGLRVILGPDALQFPSEGLMTSRRASTTKDELHPNDDTWAIGDNS
jgi:hypothetical protein